MRILELLIQKDEEAVKNIGDPSALMGVYDIEEEEKITADAIEQGKSRTDFEKALNHTAGKAFDPLKILMGKTSSSAEKDSTEKIKTMPSLYKSDYHYFKKAVEYLKQTRTLQSQFSDDKAQVLLTATRDLKHRLKYVLPKEAWPDDGVFVLSADKDIIQDEIKRSRKDENAWPSIHYLWQHNPILEWINDKIIAGFRRHEAPVLSLSKILPQGETIFILSGLIPNLKGHPLIHNWFAVVFDHDKFLRVEPFETLLKRTGLDSAETSFPNREDDIDIRFLQNLLPEAVLQAKLYMSKKRKTFEDNINEKLNIHLTALENLKDKHHEQLDIFYQNKKQTSRKEQEQREIDRKFNEFITWVEETMTTEDNPFIQVIAAFCSSFPILSSSKGGQ